MRKIWRDIWSRRVRTLLVSTSIFIGVLGVVTLISASELLVNQLEEDIQEERLIMTRVVMSVRSGAEIDNEAFLTTVQSQPGVTHAEARSISKVQWRLPDSYELEDGTIVAHSEPYAQSYLQPTRLIEGRYPQNTTEDAFEIAIERRFADARDLDVGDTLELRLLNQDTLENGTLPTQTVSINGEDVTIVEGDIVGIVFQPYGYNVGLDLGDPDTLIFGTFEEVQAVAGVSGFNLLAMRYETFEQAKAAKVDLEATTRNSSNYVPVNTSLSDPAKNEQIEQTRSTGAILVVLAVIALIVSGFLIVNVVSAIVSEQRRQIGIMKSLGASNWDTFVMYSGIAMAYGLIGAIPGVLLGIPGGYFAAQSLANVFETVLEDFDIVPLAILLGLFLGLAVPLLASIVPVILGSRVSILEAITDLGIGSKFGRGRFEQWVGALPVPISIRQSVNNAFQKKYRLLLTGVTLTMASAAFMGIFSVFFGLSQLVDASFGTFGYQIAVNPNEGQNFATVASLIRDNIDGIDDIEPGVQLSIDIEGFDAPPVVAGPPGINATGFNTANPDVLNLDLVQGTAWESDPDRDGVVISTRIEEYTGKGDGDEITIIAAGNTRTFDIIGVANWPFNDVWFKWQELAEFGGLLEPSGEPYANSINIILEEEDPTADAVDDKADEINDLLLNNGITANLNNIVAFSELITRIVVIFGVTLSLAAFLIAAVGGVGLLTTLSISVFERQKEIGVMRSVGATSLKVAQQFLTEGLVVGIVAWLIAVPLSLGIRQLLLAGLPFGDIFEIGYPPLTLVVGLMGMLVLVVVASLWPSFSAARRTVSDILRYQ